MSLWEDLAEVLGSMMVTKAKRPTREQIAKLVALRNKEAGNEEGTPVNLLPTDAISREIWKIAQSTS